MFRDPTSEERFSCHELEGRRIQIYWDGDKCYYPARVIRYNPQEDNYTVLYENDDTNQEYTEDLKNTIWEIWEDVTLLELEVQDDNLPVSAVGLRLL